MSYACYRLVKGFEHPKLLYGKLRIPGIVFENDSKGMEPEKVY